MGGSESGCPLLSAACFVTTCLIHLPAAQPMSNAMLSAKPAVCHITGGWWHHSPESCLVLSPFASWPVIVSTSLTLLRWVGVGELPASRSRHCFTTRARYPPFRQDSFWWGVKRRHAKMDPFCLSVCVPRTTFENVHSCPGSDRGTPSCCARKEWSSGDAAYSMMGCCCMYL